MSPPLARARGVSATLLFSFDQYLVDAVDDGSLLPHVLFEAVVADVTASEDHFQALCSIVLLNEADFHFLDPRKFC